MTHERIMYDKIMAHANCTVELDMNYSGEQLVSAIEIANYHDGDNVAIECVKCNEVIIDFDNPSVGYAMPDEGYAMADEGEVTNA